MCYKDEAEGGKEMANDKIPAGLSRVFKGARNRATFVMNGARCEYYTNLIAENSSNQRNLFRTTKLLLCEPSEVSFPKDIAPDDLANDFGNFFMQKIDKINQLIDMQGLWRCQKPEKRGALILIRVQVSRLPILKRCLKSKSLSSSRKLPRNHVRWIQCLLR